jgi:hypothetical protein
VSETAALRRPFLIGLLATAIVVLLLSGVIAVFSSVDDRPEGVAERWLTAVGDLTRKGVHDDAAARVVGHGDLSLGEAEVGRANDYDGKSAFSALEVGKAKVDGDLARVPAKVTYRATHNTQTRSEIVTLRRTKDSWRVVAIENPNPTLKVPSDGGDVASKAPIGLYAVALLIGAGIAVTASALVRAAGREHELRSAVT